MLRDVDLPVARQHRPNVVAQPPQLLGQRRGHIRDAAHLRERGELRCRNQNLQWLAVLGLDHRGHARHSQAHRPVRWNLLDVVPIAADDQGKLDRVAGAAAQLRERHR